MRTKHSYLTPVLILVLLVGSPAGAEERNFPAGSWIIPMDSPYQEEVGQGLFEAYGFVYELLANGVTVYWMINDAKTSKDQIDFTIHDAGVSPVVELVSHAGGTTGLAGVTNTISYSGGPWVIDAEDVEVARKVLANPNGSWDAVNVHESKVPFSGNVQQELSGTPPKVALMSDSEDLEQGDAVKIMASYLVLANICGDAFEVVTPNQVRDGILDRVDDPFTILWVPHWEGYGGVYADDNDGNGEPDVEQIVTKIREFLGRGNAMFAECASIETFEHSMNGHFLTGSGLSTTLASGGKGAGIGHNGGFMNSGHLIYNYPEVIFSQVGLEDLNPTGGHLANFRPFVYPDDVSGPWAEPYDQNNGLTPVPSANAHYNSTVKRFVFDDRNMLNIPNNEDQDQWDYYVGGNVDGNLGKGYVLYLGGHTYVDAGCGLSMVDKGDGGLAIPGPTGTHHFSMQFDAAPPAGATFSLTFSSSDSAGTAYTTTVDDLRFDQTDVSGGKELVVDFSNAVIVGSTISNILVSNTIADVLTINQIRVSRTDGLALTTPQLLRVSDDDIVVDFYSGAGLSLPAVVPLTKIPQSNYQIMAGSADSVATVWAKSVAGGQLTTFTVTYEGGQTLSIDFDQSGHGVPADVVTSADGALQIDLSGVATSPDRVDNIVLRDVGLTTLNIEAVGFSWTAGVNNQRFKDFLYEKGAKVLSMDSFSPAFGSFGTKSGTAPVEVPIAPVGFVDTTSCGFNPGCSWKSAAAVRYVLNTLFNLQFQLLSNNPIEFSRSAPIVDKDNLLVAGTFEYPGWRGHLRAYDATQPGSAAIWDAANAMPAADGRTIFTNTGGVISDGDGLQGASDFPTKTPFTFGNAHTLAPYLAMSDPVDLDDKPEQQVINRVRGRAFVGTDPSNPADYQDMENRLGGIEHSAAAIVGPTGANIAGGATRARVAYVGSLDGILHAFDAGHQDSAALDPGAGVEKWGFIPGEVLPRLQNDRNNPAAPEDYAAVDASSTVADVKIKYVKDAEPKARTVLVGTEGYGGQSVFALDISDPDADKWEVLWEVTDIRPPQGDEVADTDTNGDGVPDAVQMGHAYKTAISRVFLNTNPAEATYVVYVATGYAVPGQMSGGVRVYAFRLDNAQKLWEFHASYNRSVNDIPGALTVVDQNNDGFADWVFVGDNNGRLWQLSANTGENPYGGAPLYDAGNDDPIATSPAVAVAGGEIVLFFGTGGTDWAPADANHIHKIIAVKAGPPADHADVGQGVGEVLFSYDLDVGEKVFASPILSGDILFVGTVVGTVESANPTDDYLADGMARGSLRALDVGNAVGGAAGDPTVEAKLDNAGNFRGTLHVENGAVYGASVNGDIVQLGNAGAPNGAAAPPVERVFWREAATP